MTRSNTPTVTAPSSTDSETYNAGERLRGKLVDVWPYVEATFPPQTFVEMWNTMIEDKTLNRAFYETTEFTFPELVRFFDIKLHPRRLLLIYTDKMMNYAGFGWWDDVIPGVRAFANICMSKAFWGRPTDEASRISFDYIFHAYDVPRVFAVQPKPNRIALAYSIRLGFRPVTVIPAYTSYHGMPTDVTLTMLTREDFDHGRERWGNPAGDNSQRRR